MKSFQSQSKMAHPGNRPMKSSQSSMKSIKNKKNPLGTESNSSINRNILSDITNESTNFDNGEGIISLRKQMKEKETRKQSTSSSRTFFHATDDEDNDDNYDIGEEIHANDENFICKATGNRHKTINSNGSLEENIHQNVSEVVSIEKRSSIYKSKSFDSKTNSSANNQSQSRNSYLVPVDEDSEYASTPEKDVHDLESEEVLKEFYTKLDELNDKNEELHLRVVELEKQKEAHEAALKQKDIQIQSYRRKEGITIPQQEGIQEMTEKIQKLQEQLLHERALKIKAEDKIEELQQINATNQDKFQSTISELESAKMLMRLLEEKYRQSELSLTAIKDKYNSDTDQTLKDKEEIFSLRREVSEMCESVLAEKQKVENLEKQTSQLQKHNAEYKLLVSDLQDNEKELKKIFEEMEQSQVMTKARNEKLKAQLTSVKQASEKEKQSLTQSISQLEELNVKYEEKHHQLSENIESLNQKLSEKDKTIIEMKKKVKGLEEDIRQKDEREKQMKEKRANLMKKLEKETKAHKSALERLQDSESRVSNLSQRVQELESHIMLKEKKIEQNLQRITSLETELENEKQKGDRTWNELESTMNLLKEANDDKEKMRSEIQMEQQLKLKDYENKLKMVENKCSYYERLNELAVSKKADSNSNQNLLKRMNQDFIELLKEVESLSQSSSEKETQYDQLKMDYDQTVEKLRQTEDLLYESNRKIVANRRSSKNSPRDDSEQKLLIMEQCVDEILLETCINGVNPSKMSVREKLVAIVNQIQKLREDSKSTQKSLGLVQLQCMKLEQIRIYLERRCAESEHSDVSKGDLEQLNTIFENMESLTEERNQLQEQLDQLLSQQGGEIPFFTEKSSGSILNLINNISNLLRDHENLLMTSERIDETLMKQFNTIHFKFKDLIYSLESTPLSSDVTSTSFQTNSKHMSLIRQDEKITKLKYKIAILEEKVKDYHQALEEKSDRIATLERFEKDILEKDKNILTLKDQISSTEDRMSKLTQMNNEYKDVIAQFTQLIEQQREHESQKKHPVEVREKSSTRKSSRPQSYAGLHLKQSRT